MKVVLNLFWHHKCFSKLFLETGVQHLCLIVAFDVTLGKNLLQNSFESHKNTISAGHVHQEVMQKRKKWYFFAGEASER